MTRKLTLSKEMTNALHTLAERGWRTPANSGYSRSTYNALVKRGLATTENTELTGSARRYDITAEGKDLASRLPRYRTAV